MQNYRSSDVPLIRPSLENKYTTRNTVSTSDAVRCDHISCFLPALLVLNFVARNNTILTAFRRWFPTNKNALQQEFIKTNMQIDWQEQQSPRV